MSNIQDLEKKDRLTNSNFQQTTAIFIFFLIGKCASGCAFNLVWTITAELFPTNLRSQAVGFSSTFARIFGLLCPFIANLSVYWGPLPMLVLGLPCLVGGTLCYFIPETKNKELPQNMKDTLNNDNIEEMIEMNKAEVDKEKPIIKTNA